MSSCGVSVLSQTVWVQGCGVVKCCGGLAGDRRQQLVGKGPGASPHNPQQSKTLLFFYSLCCGTFVVYTVHCSKSVCGHVTPVHTLLYPLCFRSLAVYLQEPQSGPLLDSTELRHRIQALGSSLSASRGT